MPCENECFAKNAEAFDDGDDDEDDRWNSVQNFYVYTTWRFHTSAYHKIPSELNCTTTALYPDIAPVTRDCSSDAKRRMQCFCYTMVFISILDFHI